MELLIGASILGTCGTASASSLISPASVATVATSAEATPPVNIPESSKSIHTPEKDTSITTDDASSPSNQVGSLDDSLSDSPGKTKKRNRCYTCRKKVGLTGNFECSFFL